MPASPCKGRLLYGIFDKKKAMQTIHEQKARLRKVLRTKRAAIDPAMRREMDQRRYERCIALPQISAAQAVFCFVSMPEEAGTHALIKALLGVGKSLSVPKITPEKMLAVTLTDWGQLGRGEFGILRPRSSNICTDKIDVCITPGLGFSEQGMRIGSGRGYYDTWFWEHPDTLRIALAYECQIMDEIPSDEHDILIDLIITEERVITTHARRR